MQRYNAHSPGENGGWHSLKDHLNSVADLAAEFAGFFGAEQEARLAGQFHDLGKYGDLFQERLKNPNIKGIDHWTIGAWALAKEFGNPAASLAVAGHHLGLPLINNDTFNSWNPIINPNPQDRRLSEKNYQILLKRLADDQMPLPETSGGFGCISEALINPEKPAPLTMLDLRMLFSALVDADFLDTEAHFNRNPKGEKQLRPKGPDLNPERALKILFEHIAKLNADSRADEPINAIRQELLQNCLDRGSDQTGLFTLTAPTGAGKTLAMLAFALRHAQVNKLRRVVIVIPYLSIIEQTAKVYQEIFAPHLPDSLPVENYILENHSMANARDQDTQEKDSQDRKHRTARLLAENWDAPIIITTSVQILESMFACRPAKCRKLHRLAQSVILFDEVQTLPTHLAIPTLTGLARLAESFSSSVVFSTATQPAFSSLEKRLQKFADANWSPKEIVSNRKEMFQKAKRVRIIWPEPGKQTTLSEIAVKMAQEKSGQVLCVVNLKSQAKALLQHLRELGTEGLFHLSTDMCPAHRARALRQVRVRLKDPQKPPVFMVSTQCIEAGVDIDIPVLYRAWGPLTSIAQAAGRCNRNGNLALGKVVVFNPAPEGNNKRLYPDDAYLQAAQATQVVLNDDELGEPDINDPKI
jgi:CRISPR-associated helicase Cas3/CRISPR-associated endonuclease Cas3-HD